jgi:hypothetical protein
MKPLRLVALVLVCVMGVAGCAPAATLAPPTPVPPTPAADLVAPLKAWVDGMNKGDVDVALAPLADDVTWGGWVYPAGGKPDVRRIFELMAGIGTKLGTPDCQPQAGRVACTLTVGDGCMAAYGLADGVNATLEFVYGPDGKVRQGSLDVTGDPRW